MATKDQETLALALETLAGHIASSPRSVVGMKIVAGLGPGSSGGTVIGQKVVAVIPINDVCRDYFPHLTPTKLVQKISAGEIAIPLVRIESSQKSAKGVHLADLAEYLDARAEAGTCGAVVRLPEPGRLGAPSHNGNHDGPARAGPLLSGTPATLLPLVLLALHHIPWLIKVELKAEC
jgi:Pyocin activator protein PrtN